MSRRAALLAIVVLTCFLFPASAAWSAPVAGGALTNGTAVNGAVSTADGIQYTFTAVQGRHVTLALTAPNVSPAGNRLQMNVFNSSGATDAAGTVFSTAATQIDFTPNRNQIGTTTVLISPYDSAARGTFTLTYALDVTGVLTSGTPVTGVLSSGGQRTAYTFTAVQGKHLTLALTAPHVSPAASRLQMNVFNSSGATDAAGTVFSTGPTEIDFTPGASQSGPTTVVISGYDTGTTGSFTLTYATDVTGALTSAVAKNGSITYAGQATAYTFTAVQGKHVTLALTGMQILPAGNRLQMNVYNSSGNPDVAGAVFSNTPTELDFTPSAEQSGTTTVVISRYDSGTTGSFTLTYATDVTGALTSTAPENGSIAYAGQATAYTFTAVAGVPVKLAVTSPQVTPTGNRLQLNVYNSSGATDASGAVFSTTPTEIDFTPTPAQAGTTTVVISRYDFETTGSFTLTYTAG